MAVAPTTLNAAHAQLDARQTPTLGIARMARLKIVFGTSTPPNINTDNENSDTGRDSNNNADAAYAWSFGTKQDAGVLGDTGTMGWGFWLFADNDDGAGIGTSKVQFINLTKNGATQPAQEFLVTFPAVGGGGAYTEQANGSGTIAASIFGTLRPGSFRIVPVMWNITDQGTESNASPPLSNQISNNSAEFYIDADGSASPYVVPSTGPTATPCLQERVTGRDAHIRRGYDVQSIISSVSPLQGYTDAPTITVDPTAGGTVSYQKQLRYGIYSTATNPATTALIKTQTVTVSGTGAAVPGTSYGIDTLFSQAASDHFIAAGVGPVFGQSTTPSGEKPNCVANNTLSAGYPAADQAWVHFGTNNVAPTVADTSGNGRTGTLVGTAYTTDKLVLDGIDLDADSAGMRCGVSGFGVSTADGSFEFTATVNLGRDGQLESFGGKWGTGSAAKNWIVGKTDAASGNKAFVAAFNSVPAQVNCIGTATLTVAGGPYLIKGLWTGAQLEIYVNGVLEATTPLASLQAPDGTTPMWIGRDDDLVAGAPPIPFKGTIDDVEFKKGGVVQASYAFASAAGTARISRNIVRAAQGISAGHDVQIESKAVVSGRGARKFLKADFANTQATDAAWNKPASNGFVFAGWIKNLANGTVDQFFAGKHGGTFATAPYVIYRDNATNKIGFSVRNSANTANQLILSNTVLAGNETDPWHFVMAWYDPASGGTVNIQVDNGTVQSAAATGGVNTSLTGIFTIGYNNSSIGVDADLCRFILAKPSAGTIGSVVAAMSTSLYNAGSGKKGYQLTTQERTDWGVVSAWDLDETHFNSPAWDAYGVNDLTSANGSPVNVPEMGDSPFTLYHRNETYRFDFTFKNVHGVHIEPANSTALTARETGGSTAGTSNDTNSPYTLKADTQPSAPATYDLVGHQYHLRSVFAHYGANDPSFNYTSGLGLIFRLAQQIQISTLPDSINNLFFVGKTSAPTISDAPVRNRGQQTFFRGYIYDCRGERWGGSSASAAQFGFLIWLRPLWSLAFDSATPSQNLEKLVSGEFGSSVDPASLTPSSSCIVGYKSLVVVQGDIDASGSNKPRTGTAGSGNHYETNITAPTIADDSGNGHTGTFEGPMDLAPSVWVDTDDFLRCLNCEGTDRGTTDTAGVNIPAFALIGPFTIEAKVFLTGSSTPGSFAAALTKYSTANKHIWLGMNGNKVYSELQPVRTLTGTTVMLVKTRYHIAQTFDGTTAKLWLKKEGETVSLEASGSATNSSDPAPAVPWRIGRSSESSPFPFPGLIEEVRVSNIDRSGGGTYSPPYGQFTNDANTVALYRADTASSSNLLRVTNRGQLERHLQLNFNDTLDPSANVGGRQASQLGFYSVKATDGNGDPYDGATGGVLTLQDDQNLTTAIVSSALTTQTISGFAGYTELQPWSAALPGGGWDLWASTEFTNSGNTWSMPRQTRNFYDFVLKAINPDAKIIAAVEASYLDRGEPFTISASAILFDENDVLSDLVVNRALKVVISEFAGAGTPMTHVVDDFMEFVNPNIDGFSAHFEYEFTPPHDGTYVATFTGQDNGSRIIPADTVIMRSGGLPNPDYDVHIVPANITRPGNPIIPGDTIKLGLHLFDASTDMRILPSIDLPHPAHVGAARFNPALGYEEYWDGAAWVEWVSGEAMDMFDATQEVGDPEQFSYSFVTDATWIYPVNFHGIMRKDDIAYINTADMAAGGVNPALQLLTGETIVDPAKEGQHITVGDSFLMGLGLFNKETKKFTTVDAPGTVILIGFRRTDGQVMHLKADKTWEALDGINTAYEWPTIANPNPGAPNIYLLLFSDADSATIFGSANGLMDFVYLARVIKDGDAYDAQGQVRPAGPRFRHNQSGDLLFARVASTANLVLSGLVTVDGITPSAGDFVLVKNQTDATENGLYVAAAGAWSRARGFTTYSGVKAGTQIVVLEGGTGGGKVYRVDTNDPITIGVTEIAIELMSGGSGSGASEIVVVSA